MKTLKFEGVFARGDVPNHRDEHTALLYDHSMVIFGGFKNDGERSNDIYRYIFKENRWEKIEVQGSVKPQPRAGHSAVLVEDMMIIFAGKTNGDERLNDVWMFNFLSLQWAYVKVPEAPLERSGHSASMYRDYMVVFGGIYEVTKELNDLCLFDIRNKRWIFLFEETHSPVAKKSGGLAGNLGASMESKDDASPHSQKKGGFLDSNYSLIKPMGKL